MRETPELGIGIGIDAWIGGLRLALAVFVVSGCALALIFLRTGRLPPALRAMLQSCALLWPFAYTVTLHNIEGLKAFDKFFGLVLPTLVALVLPDFAYLCMHGFYALFGWPSSYRILQKQIERDQLEHSLLRRKISHSHPHCD